MNIYSKREKFVKDGVDYDSLYEKNTARVDFVIKFDSEVDAVAAMNDIEDLDEETKIFDVVQDGKQITVNTDCDRMVELMTSDLDSEDIITNNNNNDMNDSIISIEKDLEILNNNNNGSERS